jgi:glycosyltransferase involved in cell wall biosynthesis
MTNRRVLIDGYYLGKPYGFGRYIFEISRALGRAEPDIPITVAVPAGVEQSLLPEYRKLSWHRMPNAHFPLWEQVMIPRLARRLGCDVIHSPYNTRALFTGGIRSVVTVHDLMFLEEHVPLSSPKAFVTMKYMKYVFRYATRKSQLIVSISETTRRALLARGIESRTVYNTTDGFLAEVGPVDKPPQGGRPYLMHRGGYQEHRNTGRVIEAFRRLRQDLPDVALRIIGAPDGAGVWRVREDEGIEFLPRISDRELGELYAGSAAVLATSLQEGFGAPIIEGFGFGAPVITSRRDPMMEVAGGASLLVDPTSVEEIAAAMRSILGDPALARDLVARGRERLKAFGGDRLARQLLEVYCA